MITEFNKEDRKLIDEFARLQLIDPVKSHKECEDQLKGNDDLCDFLMGLSIATFKTINSSLDNKLRINFESSPSMSASMMISLYKAFEMWEYILKKRLIAQTSEKKVKKVTKKKVIKKYEKQK